MAKKRTLDRRTLRDQAEAAEAKGKEKDEVEEEEEEEEEEAADEDGGDDDEDGAPKKKAKPKAKAKEKKPAAAKKPAAKRSRAPKEVRLRAVWVVFDNASKRVETFPFKPPTTFLMPSSSSASVLATLATDTLSEASARDWFSSGVILESY